MASHTSNRSVTSIKALVHDLAVEEGSVVHQLDASLHGHVKEGAFVPKVQERNRHRISVKGQYPVDTQYPGSTQVECAIVPTCNPCSTLIIKAHAEPCMVHVQRRLWRTCTISLNNPA
jgi:hypothetical protein